jgi:hypothetical protein
VKIVVRHVPRNILDVSTKDVMTMRGLEEIIYENSRAASQLKTEVTELEVKKRKLLEKLAELEWEIDRNKRSVG